MTFVEKVNHAKLLIHKAIDKYPKIVCASSFGKDSMVTLHLAISVKKDMPIFSAVSDTEFPETYDFINKIVKFYNLNYTEYRYKQIGTIEECCGAPKVEATKKGVQGYDAWISGVRKDEGSTRTHYKEIEVLGNLAKINPILNFTEMDTWRYLSVYGVPVNPKYQEGYRSLGCARCSTPERDESESERAGRWRGTPKEGGECGIHLEALK